jgi:hypothetical protein
MLIDRSHIGWAAASTAIGAAAWGVYLWADRRLPGGLTGGSIAGMWFGIIGFGLMGYAASLSLLRALPDRRRLGWLRTALVIVAAAVILAVPGFIGNERVRMVVWAGIGVLGFLGAARLLQYGSRATWLKGHIWLGTLSAWFIALHSGFRLGGPLVQALWVLLALTLLTGIFGLVLQQVVPRLLTARFAEEVPVGQMGHVCGLLRQEADDLIEAIRPPSASLAAGAPGAREELWSLYKKGRRDFFAVPYRGRSRLARPRAVEALFTVLRGQPWGEKEQKALERLAEVLATRRRLGEQERLHRRLHSWLLIHIPLSAALLALGAVHAVVSLWY